MKKLESVNPYQFIDPKRTVYPNEYGINDLHVFFPFIESINRFAIGEFFWYISNNKESKVHMVSNNVGSLTPFTKEEWLSASDNFFIDLFHPDDQYYLLRAFAYTENLYLNIDETKRNNFTFNYYGRMLDKNREYRWIMINAPHNLVNSNNEVEVSLLVIYDLSHLKVNSMPLLSIMDFNNKEVQYFKHADQQMLQLHPELPQLTKREKEILTLIAKGYNTPEIAKMLFISYHTVENHKSNLRRKTNTKTAAELIAFTIKYNLIFI